MKHIFKTIILVLPIVLFTQCNGFLDKYPSTSVTGSNIYEDLNTANAALVGLYNDLQGGPLTGRNVHLRGDLKAGDFLLLTGGGQYLSTEYSYRESSSTTGNSYDIWTRAYKIIKDCNIFIAGMNTIETNDTAKKNDMIAQAEAMKAIAYMELTRAFCYPLALAKIDQKYALGVPIVKDDIDNSRIINEGASRASLVETQAYIFELLNSALSNINSSRGRGGYINKAAIQGLMARMYLWTEQWGKAAESAIAAASAGAMIGYNDYLTAIRQDLNSESLFELIYTETDNLGMDCLGYICNKTVNEQGRQDSKSVGYGEVGASDTFIALLNENPNDIRIQLLKEDKSSKGNPGEASYSARYYFKYIGGKNGNNYLHNVPIVKVPEMMLIAAESYAEMGNDAEALKYLNNVYTKRTNTTLSNLTGAALKAEIARERRRELALEGHGIYDILRKGGEFSRDMSHVTIVSINAATEAGRNEDNFHRTVAPIPLDEMDANAAIREQQNPGYGAFQGSK